MATYIAMIRGINVGGRKPVKMKDLKTACEEAGLRDVQTYIQSGNLVFRTDRRSTKAVAGVIEEIIQNKFGHSVVIIVRTRAELLKVTKNNPYLGRKGVDLRHLYVTFLLDTPSIGTTRLETPESGSDEVRLVGKEVFGIFPNGYGRTKLNNNFLENLLKTSATTRNWNTVLTLLQIASERR